MNDRVVFKFIHETLEIDLFKSAKQTQTLKSACRLKEKLE
jgi:hypothetical protein